MDNLPSFIKNLCHPHCYSHDTAEFEVIQTHLSWIILTGDYAYKIKKPVSFGFQDFTTLEKRRYYCDLEVILNQRYTTDLYEQVVPISGTEEAPLMGEAGDVFEYAVRMRQFDSSLLLGQLVEKNGITSEMIQQLAKQIAQFHLETEVCRSESDFGQPEVLKGPVDGNFSALKDLLTAPEDLALCESVAAFANTSFEQLKSLFSKRKQSGFVRACHGDLHLANAVLINGAPTFFDCIEFNDSFRHTDVIADIAFLIMDLKAFNRPDLAILFLNTYLEHTGDYEGVLLLDFYCAYRAMVRAKVAMLGAQPETIDDALSTCRRYMKLALTFFENRTPALWVTCGLSGSGKSHYSSAQMITHSAIRLRSDVERKRLAGLLTHTASPMHARAHLYSAEMTTQVFEVLAQTAEMLLKAGWPVIIDSAALLKNQRQAFWAVAERLNCPFHIWWLTAPEQVLIERLNSRLQEASDADASILKMQNAIWEPLTEDELEYTTTVCLSTIAL